MRLAPVLLLIQLGGVCWCGCAGNMPGLPGNANDEPNSELPDTECERDNDCQDGVFCNGREECVDGRCFIAPGRNLPCQGFVCDERTDGCVPIDEEPEVGEPEAEVEDEWELSSVLPSLWQVIAFSASAPDQGLIATAFAIDPKRLATNAHVVLGIANVLAHSDAAAVVVQHESGTSARISRVWVHPSYNGDPFTSPDVGIIEVAGRLPGHLDRATYSEALSLEILDPVTLCGFPGDVAFLIDFANLEPDETIRPRASCYEGSISALRPLDPSEAATPTNSVLVQHSIASTGGTSGSPLLDNRGRVIAVHAATTTDEAGTNRFAARIDAVGELLDWIDNGTIDALEPVEIIDDVGLAPTRVFDGDWAIYGSTGKLGCLQFETGVLVHFDTALLLQDHCDVDPAGFYWNRLDAPATALSTGGNSFSLTYYYSFGSAGSWSGALTGTIINANFAEAYNISTSFSPPVQTYEYPVTLVREPFN